MKKVVQTVTSLKLMLLLLVIFAVSIGAATFIENDYGVETSWALIYATKWFEILQLILALSIIGNIFIYKMFTLRKFPILIFHVAFVVILIGSAMTRYFGYEGTLNIREGNSSQNMLSSDSFLQIKATDGINEAKKDNILYVSKLGGNNFNYNVELDNNKIEVSYKNFIENAQKRVQPIQNGKAVFEIEVETAYDGRKKYFIENGSLINSGVFNIYFNKKPAKDYPYIYFYTKNDKQYFISNHVLGSYDLTTEKKSVFEVNTEYALEPNKLFYTNNFKMLPTKTHKSAEVVVEKKIKSKNEEKNLDLSALIVDVKYKGQTKEVALFGRGKNFKGFDEYVSFGDTTINLQWGSKIITLPFSLHLRDFIIYKYPGSNSPSSYESKVTLIDNRDAYQENYRIYMNNVLTYDGYTFFQASFDKDEKGTVLSVNKDPGKWPTYLGYFLLIFGLFVNLLNPHSRFMKLSKTKYSSFEKISTFLLVSLFFTYISTPLYAVDVESRKYVNNLSYEEVIKEVKKVDLEYANNFSTILVQTKGGRIQPIDTFSIDSVNKITSKSALLGLTYNQAFLGMLTKPKYWQRIELFKVKHSRIKRILGMNQSKDRISYIDMFDAEGQYKINTEVNEAFRRKPGNRGTFEKELIKIDEKLNVAYSIFEGEFLKIFPIDKSNTAWLAPKYIDDKVPSNVREEINKILVQNAEGTAQGYRDGNWNKANKSIEYIKDFQKKYSSNILPNEFLQEIEILYNKLGIFQKLFPVYLLCGLVLLFMVFAKLIKPSLKLNWVVKTIFVIVIVGFLAHTFNLGLRWYISGHAPWSNSYEAMLYISWTIILAGIIFSKNSDFALSTSSVFAGITLFVAHLSWLDPQITNLVPVLKSYWLTIHVSIITASYGFLGLSAMLGFISLILFIMLRFVKEEEIIGQIIINIKESVRINEMSMTIGLTLLITGNFLGGIWANESWGRYWGWDPKETWTLVTVIVYAIILHIRYIPKVNTVYLFSVLSLISFSTVIMTYFGVNYYLSGLHSYAAGDPVPVPIWIYYVVTVIILFIVFAFSKRNLIKKYKIKCS